ncbi:uncharacterized protein LOC117112058 [Anneissia japonica]|uniref:uncharacterized protein LOC117112058 n=1 Tax=Anneissia japonica TaxID=1529436 RepID=UPI00142586BE|nr:uncharacterized protein LOC117112058 [Anneissia japonica]
MLSTIDNNTISYELPGIVKRRADRIESVNKCIRFLGNVLFSKEEFLNSTISGTNAQGEIVNKLDEKKLEATEDYIARRFTQFGGVAKIREIVGKRCREIQRLAREK